MYFYIKEALISDVQSQLKLELANLLTQVQAQDFFHDSLYPAFRRVPLYDGDWDIASKSEFIKEYSAFLAELLTDDLPTKERLAIHARLFVLGKKPQFKPEKVPFELVEYLLNHEVPEDFHDWLDETLAAKKALWPRYPKSSLSPSRLTYLFLEQDNSFNDAQVCIRLTTPSGKALYSNMDNYSPASLLLDAGFAIWVAPAAVNEKTKKTHKSAKSHSSNTCLVYSATLSDGGHLLLGQPIDHSYPLLHQLKHLLLFGLGCLVILALLCGYWVAARAVKPISAINALCEKISQGQLNLRVKYHRSDDDYSKLANNINMMLDRIVELLQSVKRVSDNIAHDLKTPLTRMQHQLMQLQQNPSDTPQAIADILKENERIIQCFNALLRIAEIEQGAQRQAFSHFHFSELIETLTDLYEPAMEQKNLTLVVENNAANDDVFADKHQWLQALVNLLDNAIKFSEHAGVINLRLTSTAEQLTLVIKDQGPGIPQDKLQAVFDRFYRLETHRNTPGFGLGLSLVKAVCQRHGAIISLQNDAGLQVSIVINLAL